MRSIEGTSLIEKAALKNANANILKKRKDVSECLSQEENWKNKNNSTKKIRNDVGNENLTEAIEIEERNQNQQNTDTSNPNLTKEVTEIETIVNINESNENRKIRGKYLTPCPEIELLHERTLRRPQNLNALNGSLCSLVNIGEKSIQLTNTCAFDSFTEILTTAYIDNVVYKQQIDNIQNSPLTDYIKLYATNGVTKDLYTKRAHILCNRFKTSGQDNKQDNNTINCTTNAGVLAINLLQEDMFSCKIVKLCESCRSTSSTYKSIDLIEFKKLNKSITDLITKFFETEKIVCKKCKQYSEKTKLPGIHIIVGTEK